MGAVARKLLDADGGQEMTCWFLKPKPPCFILLGRNGDIIQLLPCFKAIHDRLGDNPVVIVSTEYAGVFDGVSYVTPHVINEDWREVTKAVALAARLYGGGITAQWWKDTPDRIRATKPAARGGIVLQSHGINWGVDTAKWPDYGTSMADRCGFSRDEWLSLLPVFDRRNPRREEQLAASVIGGERKPVVLYNFAAMSAPCPHEPEVINPALQQFGNTIRFINIGPIKAFRIFDLLGLYDRAIGLLTCDTATLHLASATPLPYIGFLPIGWATSIPKGNCVYSCYYNQIPSRIPEIMGHIGRWAANARPPVV